MEKLNRKTVRLRDYDYNTPGFYFITLCTHNKEKLLCEITDESNWNTVQIHYTPYGQIAIKQLQDMREFYNDIYLEKYVVMPNHIHLLLQVKNMGNTPNSMQNSRLSQFVGTFKRFCNRQYGRNIWQSRSYDHVIRGDEDYRTIWEYIDNNARKWKDDQFWSE